MADLLNPKTDQEHRLVNWLGEQLDLQDLLCLVELIGYAHDEDVSS